MGGGPAGSFFTYFLLDMAERMGTDIQVDVYEPRDFFRPGPPGCNMCGGIVSESLVQLLASEGINLPPTVVQRGIDSYVLHMDAGSVRIDTPLQEKRIGAVYRGPGPRDIKKVKWESFDGHLQSLAVARGANLIRARVTDVRWSDGRPEIVTANDQPKKYDLLAVSVGVNTVALKLFQNSALGYQAPRTTKTMILEYSYGDEPVGAHLGSSMHVFLLDIPRLEFAALVPKGDYMSLCLLGEDIDEDMVRALIESPELASTSVPLSNPSPTGPCSLAIPASRASTKTASVPPTGPPRPRRRQPSSTVWPPTISGSTTGRPAAISTPTTASARSSSPSHARFREEDGRGARSCAWSRTNRKPDRIAGR
jgi:hypothetical protein